MFMSSTLRNFDHGKTINLYRHRFQDTGISTAKIPSFFQMYGNIQSLYLLNRSTTRFRLHATQDASKNKLYLC